MDKLSLCLLLLAVFMVPGFTAAAKPSQVKQPKATKAGAQHWTSSSDVIWTTPSKDSAGSMPLGNGEVGINFWVEDSGDLLFYISRTDSFSETARLLKVGKLRVSLSPNPFAGSATFRQHLKLRDGVCEITAGSGAKKVTLRVFVDANQPVVHVAGASASPLRVLAKVESWREQPHTIPEGAEQFSSWSLVNAPFPVTESADIFPPASGDAVSWYHRNETSPSFEATMKVQNLESIAHLVDDPILHRTFGGWVTGTGFAPTDNRTLATTAPMKAFSLRVAAPSLQVKSVGEWTAAAKRAAAASSDAEVALSRTTAWWRAFWDRSWIVAKGAEGFDIPGQAHALRVGYDSNRQNTFPGEIGRNSVYSRALSDSEVGQLAEARRSDEAPIKSGKLVSSESASQEVSQGRLKFRSGFTLEAWVKPDSTRDGRIFDKMTVGSVDGFLFDTYPKDSLRFIVGAETVQAPAALLAANSWQHVAATFDAKTGAMRVYLNGKVVAERAASTRTSLTQAYTLQRYMQACAGRGNYPIKFNGSIFTVDPQPLEQPFNVDWRMWGEQHWYQNLRFIYHAMLASGDTDMMEPFFRLYTNVRPLAEARTPIYYKSEGAFFPETMTIWGAYGNNDYGWDRKGKADGEADQTAVRHIWSQGPELVSLMLDRWDYTRDKRFLQKETLPMAVSVMKYFDTRFKKDAKGKIIIDPTQAVESVSTDVVNDLPNAAGLTDITTRLLALPDSLTTPEQRAFFKHMKAAAPDVPVEEVDVNGKKTRVLAPAQKYKAHRTNSENPELYAVWPFRLYGIDKPNIDEARAAYARRSNINDVGWGYDANAAALLGMTDEAARSLKVKLSNSHPAYRWPASWGPNYDWMPDQDHGSNLLIATQLMLLQGQGKRILVLPAWPKEWDVSFKLHAPQKTVVECVYRGGKIESLVVTPASRRKDVVLPADI